MTTAYTAKPRRQAAKVPRPRRGVPHLRHDQDMLDDMEAFRRREVTASPEVARGVLVRAGLISNGRRQANTAGFPRGPWA